MENKHIQEFKNQLSKAIINPNSFIELICTSPKDKASDLKRHTYRSVSLKKGDFIQCVHRFKTRDITKNYTYDEALNIISTDLENTFQQFMLHLSDKSYHLNKSNKISLSIKEQGEKKTSVSHNKAKSYLIPEEAEFLHWLGLASASKKIKASQQAKFRQINKFVEIIDQHMGKIALDNTFDIYDMGSGSAYLSFALYYHLTQNREIDTHLTGIEMRKALVDKCNNLAKQSGFSGLEFKEGLIKESQVKSCHMLIALHACDIATDDAIFKGIKAGADYIICSPCCHRQVRRAMNSTSDFKAITKHGILLERQAELLTDTIRSLLLEASGYKTKVIEFISTEHTAKNLMIIATKKKGAQTDPEKHLSEVEMLKQNFGIKNHYLQDILYPS